MLYVLTVVVLMLLVQNLSDTGQFQAEVLRRTQSGLNDIQMGASPVFILPPFEITLFGMFFLIVPWIFRWVMELGYLYYVRTISQGEPGGYRSLLEGFNYFFRAIFLRFFLFVVTSIAMFFFIVPGLVLICMFSQVNFLLLDNPDKGVFWLLGESRRLMRGRKWEYFKLMLSFFGWFLLTGIPIISYAAQLWFMPYFNFTAFGYYQRITGQGPKNTDADWKRPSMF